jgi:LacI family transcriptional regulator
MDDVPPPTIREIAEKMGYSTATVSMALRNRPKIPAATRKKIQEAASSMGYHLDPHLSRLMTYMRGRRHTNSTYNVAWIHCSDAPDSFHHNPECVGLIQGARTKAKKLGLFIDEIWVPIKSVQARVDFTRLLLARGIQGILIAPPWVVDADQVVDWSKFSTVMLADSSYPPFVNRVSPDYFADMSTAMSEALKLGYKRPGYCRTEFFDLVSVGRYTGAFFLAQDALPPENRVPSPAVAGLGAHYFSSWLKEQRPDVLITPERETLMRVRSFGLRVPEDIGIIHLNLKADVGDWSGIDQRHHLLGSAAIDMLSAHINRGELGIPEQKKEMLLEGIWQEGVTTRRISTCGGAG